MFSGVKLEFELLEMLQKTRNAKVFFQTATNISYFVLIATPRSVWSKWSDTIRNFETKVKCFAPGGKLCRPFSLLVD